MPDFIFTHIPKTAGTSIGLCIAKQNMGHRFHDHLTGKLADSTYPVSFHHQPPGWLTPDQLKIYKSYTSFTVVRNPYERALSQYFMIARSRYWNISAEAMNEYLQINCVPGNLVHDGHFIPQYDYCYTKSGERIVDHIMRYESLHRDFENLMSELGLDLKLNRHDGKGRDHSVTIQDMSRQTLDLINQTYHKDFQVFNYGLL